MDGDKLTYLRRFGFLPAKHSTTAATRKTAKKPQRYYLDDVHGIYLTEREAEVSWYLSRGFTVREAARQMQLSPRTAEFYLSNIRRRLGVRNKTELLHLLLENDFFQRLR